MIKFHFCYLSILILSIIISDSMSAQDIPNPVRFAFYTGAPMPAEDFGSSTGYNAGFATTGLS